MQAPNTVVEGNPALEAELTDLYEFGYSTFFKTTSISASIYTRTTDNAIETLPHLEGDTTMVITFRNIAQNKTYGIRLFGSTKPLQAWTVGGSSNTYFVDLNSNAYDSNSGWMYNINLNSSYDFGKLEQSKPRRKKVSATTTLNKEKEITMEAFQISYCKPQKRKPAISFF